MADEDDPKAGERAGQGAAPGTASAEPPATGTREAPAAIGRASSSESPPRP